MTRTRSFLAASAAFLAVLLTAVPAFGQETTGDLMGLVALKTDKSALPGVSVDAIHVPTGTRYTAVTRANGRFAMLNVRVGGPYTVTAKLSGFKTETKKDIAVALGEQRELDFELEVMAVREAVSVTAEAEPLISPSRMGSTQTITADELKSLPTIRRQFQDFARTNPYVNSQAYDSSGTNITFAGKNNRYNTIQIDGAVNNDLFGLSTTGTPGGQTDTQPISFETIQEVQVAVSPYDVKQGGFTGGAINMITKGGTNDFHGSAYGFTRNQKYFGSDVPQPYGDAVHKPLSPSDQSQVGASVGGPILKDRLFFFLSGEKNKLSAPTGGSADGSTVNTFKDPAAAALFQSVLTNQYHYNPGGLADYPTKAKSNLAFGRLDFNANDSNQVTVRYNYVDASNDISSPRNQNTYSFETAGYTITDKTNSIVGQVNSVFGADSFNQGRVGYQTIRDSRALPVSFPAVYICNTPSSTGCTSSSGAYSLLAGSERSSQANSLDQDILEITDDFTLVKGDHSFTIGTHNEFFKFSNVFIQDTYGTYFFNSIAALQAGTANVYRVGYANGADPRRPTKFGAQQWGVYVGDQWKVSSKLNLNLGVRFDIPRLTDSPTYNPLVYNTFGVDTSDVPGAQVVVSPRLGFNWAPDPSGKDQVRGGVGVFFGRAPFVWLSNNYGNTGVEYTNVIASNVPFNPDPNNPPRNFPPGSAAITVNGVDPKFTFPKVLRSTLGYDRELPWGIRGTVEFMFTKTLEDVFYFNLAKTPTGTYTFYGAPIYKNVSTAISDMIYLSNTARGEQQNLSVQLEKRFPFGLNLSAAYAYMNSKAGFEGGSSVAYSNWQFMTTNGDIFTHQLTRSLFEVPNRFTVVGTQAFKTGPLAHNVGLVYTAQSGQPYSVLMGGDPNKDGGSSNDLIFVPQNYSDIVWKGAGAPTETQWNTFLGTTGLDRYRGQILPRNGLDAPWIHTFDFHYDVTLPISVVNVQLSFEILNLINLINHNAGLVRYVQNQTYTALNYSGIDAASGKPIYTVNANALIEGVQYTTQNISSRYQLKWGARLSF
jgi:hypothetical protein